MSYDTIFYLNGNYAAYSRSVGSPQIVDSHDADRCANSDFLLAGLPAWVHNLSQQVQRLTAATAAAVSKTQKPPATAETPRRPASVQRLIAAVS